MGDSSSTTNSSQSMQQQQQQHQIQDLTGHGVTDVTTTSTNPQWVTDAIQGLTGNLTGIAGADPRSFIAGPSALQNQAAAGAGGLTGTPGAYNGSTDLATSVGQANAPDIASLMAPFKGAFDNRVINPALAGFDQNSALVNAQNQLGRANDATFGGSGGAITDALTRGQQALSRGQLQGGLLSDQYKTALGGATSQAGVIQNQMQQRLAAAGLISQNANDYGANQRADIGTQGAIGSILQGLQQAQAGAPVSLAGATSGILGALPLGLLHGQGVNGVTDSTSHGVSDMSGTSSGTSTGTSTTTQSDPFKTFGSLAMLAAAPFTGGASLLGGLGSLAGSFQGGGAGGLLSGFGNLFNNDPTGMWSLGSAGG